ncbi:MBL fold metallo-hydrolase [Streptomyces sp. NPDC091201]|uniref:MBL fold metallo-hydrolase n=1 Tax=Streptomyces sp. NPDC091201 TaxID=3155190 RepID=UPI003441E543
MKLKISSVEPPESDELEVSIFGPGKGESVVLHLGAGRWLVVDSCIDQQSGAKPPLEYLRRIGVDVSRDVKMIVGTHAHDDHFAGIADIFEACSEAIFVVSDALTTKEFMAQIAADAEIPQLSRSRAYREYSRIFQIAESRKKDGFRPLRRGTESLRLLSFPAENGVPAVTVTALSPSEQAKTRALKILASQAPQVNGRRGKVSQLDPNEASVALWVEFGDVRILLGADLLKGPAGCGWKAVISTHFPDAPASLYKVAHHGGESSHYQPVWDGLLTANPVALLAPFRNGNIDQPQPGDIARILSMTNRAYITASGSPTPSRAVRREASKLGSLASNVRELWGRAGHVRARRRANEGDWAVQAFPPAALLK